ncbi:hypothetical protein DFJ63DRAFT_337283 [Scheffersomyces coipomensis]|uniref:uncharacterized protein n=1 Tax=Scheffersomyces coipomensis TaxID=1788519 RepID=UPI00315D5DFC
MASSKGSKSPLVRDGDGNGFKPGEKRLNSMDSTTSSLNSNVSAAKPKSKRSKSTNHHHHQSINQSNDYNPPVSSTGSTSYVASSAGYSHASDSQSNYSALTKTTADSKNILSKYLINPDTNSQDSLINPIDISVDEESMEKKNGSNDKQVSDDGGHIQSEVPATTPIVIESKEEEQELDLIKVNAPTNTLSSSQNYLSLQEFNSITNSKFETNNSLLSQDDFLNWSLKSKDLMNKEMNLMNKLIMNRFILIKRFKFLNQLIIDYAHSLNTTESLLKLKFEKLNNLFNESLTL